MKKLMYTLLAAILFFANFAVVESSANEHLIYFQQADFKQVYKVSSSQIMIKEEPDATSKTLGSEKRGAYLVSDYLPEDGWLPVIYKGGYGFVNVSGIQFGIPTIIKISGSKGGIVIKEKATPNSKTVATLQYGMVMKDFGNAGNGYSFVQYGNVIGYAKTSFMVAPKATVKYVNSSNGVYSELRSIASPSVDGSWIDDGTKVNHYATVKGWAYVEDKASGDSGYIPANELSTNDPYAIVVVPNTNTSSNTNSYTSGGSSSSGYKNCTELRKDFPNGVKRGHWAYQSKMDRDNDGHACE